MRLQTAGVRTALAGAAATVALAAAVGGAQAQEDDINLAFVSHGQAADPFWSVVINGVNEAADDMGVSVNYVAPDTFDMTRMSQLLDAAIASQPDGLIVTIPDVDAIGDGIRDAVAQGIPVISSNAGADVVGDLGVMLHIGQTEYEAGVGGGERMAEAGVGKAVCVNHEVGNVSLDTRCEGFAEGLGGEVEVLSTQMDPTQVRNSFLAYLSNNPDVEGVLALGPFSAEPVLAALREEGMLDSVTFGTFDLSPEVLSAIEAGEMDFAIDQQQYLQGYLPVVLLTQFNRFGVMPAGDVMLTGPGFVTQENAAAVIDWSAAGYR